MLMTWLPCATPVRPCPAVPAIQLGLNESAQNEPAAALSLTRSPWSLASHIPAPMVAARTRLVADVAVASAELIEIVHRCVVDFDEERGPHLPRARVWCPLASSTRTSRCFCGEATRQ